MLEQVLKLDEIVRTQADIIDKMFILLLQHVPTEDEALKEIVEDINGITE